MEPLYIFLIVLLTIIVLILLLNYLACNIAFKTALTRSCDEAKEYNQTNEYLKNVKKVKNIENMDYEDLYISSFDNLRLHAYYYKALKPTHKTVIAVHGWKGYAPYDCLFYCEYLLRDLKYNVLMIDVRSHNQSTGKYISMGTLGHRDLLDWINLLEERDENIEIGIIGVSMGATTAMLVSDKVDNKVKCIIEDSGFNNAYEQVKYVLKNKLHFLPPLMLLMLRHLVKRKAHYDLKKYTVIDSLRNAGVPMLFIQGNKDTFVDYKNLDLLYNACTSEKEKQTFIGAKHARSYYENNESYTKLVYDFLNKYL